MAENIKRSPIKDFLIEYRGWILPLFLFNGALVYLATDTAQEHIGKSKEAVKAIAWMVTAPVCEVNGFCKNISKDENVGTFLSATIRKEENLVHGTYTQIQSTVGNFVVKGEVKPNTFTNEMTVTLHVKKGELSNVLCVDGKSCFLVPHNKKQL